MSDWQYLTSDLVGSAEVRQLFINATSEASRTFGIAPSILVAIKRTESGLALKPSITNRNNNGTVDRGFFQVSTEVWLPELTRLGTGINAEGLHGIRENALIAAWILRRQLNRSDVQGLERA